MSGTEVTSRDLATGQSETVTIVDDYVLVTEGRVWSATQVHQRFDGGWTHVITVRCDPPARPAADGEAGS